jgi:hypothetical protein
MKPTRASISFMLTLALGLWSAPLWARAGTYPDMAPLGQYLSTDTQAEVALARSAAPVSISQDATVLVLTSHGYDTAAKGTNGFTCLVERSWMKHSEDPDFWNWHMRGPVCYNPAASSSILPYTIFRTDLIVKGMTSRTQLFDRLKAAIAANQLPAAEAGGMAYMMSKQQYLADPNPAGGVTGTNWHPHVMFYAPAANGTDSGASFGANLKGSPVVFDPTGEAPEPWTVFFVPVWHWSDGSPGPVVMQHAH